MEEKDNQRTNKEKKFSRYLFINSFIQYIFIGDTNMTHLLGPKATVVNKTTYLPSSKL